MEIWNGDADAIPLLQGNELTLEEEIVKEASMDFFKVSYLHGLVMSI